MKYKLLLLLIFLCIQSQAQHADMRRNYVCYVTEEAIKLDGRLDETSWKAVPWSEQFLDIEGPQKSLPVHKTRMKMLWDEEYLYIGVHLVEPHIWATYTERESVIFHENDIEVFLDPDGDSHNYYELEVNALGTEWDLMLTKPYRNGGRAINGWNINGFKKGIHLEGTINNADDKDQYWSIEMAIPWKALSQSGPSFNAPKNGEQWRINFSRVQWQIEASSQGYRKKMNPETGRPFPEYNWVWSPMGLIDMHLPYRWGYLQFSQAIAGAGNVSFTLDPDESVKDALRDIYDLQMQFFKEHKKYALTLEELTPDQAELEEVEFEISATRFKISASSRKNETRWHITEDSRIWNQ